MRIISPGITANTKSHLGWIRDIIRIQNYNAPSPKSQMKVNVKPFRRQVDQTQNYEADYTRYPEEGSLPYSWSDEREYKIDYAEGVR